MEIHKSLLCQVHDLQHVSCLADADAAHNHNPRQFEDLRNSWRPHLLASKKNYIFELEAQSKTRFIDAAKMHVYLWHVGKGLPRCRHIDMIRPLQ